MLAMKFRMIHLFIIHEYKPAFLYSMKEALMKINLLGLFWQKQTILLPDHFKAEMGFNCVLVNMTTI